MLREKLKELISSNLNVCPNPKWWYNKRLDPDEALHFTSLFKEGFTSWKPVIDVNRNVKVLRALQSQKQRLYGCTNSVWPRSAVLGLETSNFWCFIRTMSMQLMHKTYRRARTISLFRKQKQKQKQNIRSNSNRLCMTEGVLERLKAKARRIIDGARQEEFLCSTALCFSWIARRIVLPSPFIESMELLIQTATKQEGTAGRKHI